jgi:hypothetical protein
MGVRNLSSARVIELDELPRYSGWVAYLLGLKSLSRPFDKSPENIAREYGQDKWGILLQNLRLVDNPTIEDADRLYVGERYIPFYTEGKLYIADITDVDAAYFHLIKNELQPLIQQSGHIVELGAGYGAIILKLATLPGFDTLSYTAGEFTDTGVACMNYLASEVRGRFEAGFCDLMDLNLEGYAIPEHAIFMTSWAMACIKGFPKTTLNEIIRYKPKAVIHFEPIYEHWSEDALLHMLWKKYCRMNDYNRSLLSALKEYETEGIIQIAEERKNIFGSNPLAPVSIVKWAPRAT